VQNFRGDLVRTPVVGVYSQVSDVGEVVDGARGSFRDLVQSGCRLPDQLVASQTPRRCEAVAAARDPVGQGLSASV
jgi:hypothetical protein